MRAEEDLSKHYNVVWVKTMKNKDYVLVHDELYAGRTMSSITLRDHHRVVKAGHAHQHMEKLVRNLRKIHPHLWIGIPGNLWALNKEQSMAIGLSKGMGKRWLVNFAPEEFTPRPMIYDFATLPEALEKLIQVTLEQAQHEWQLNHEHKNITEKGNNS